MAISEIGVSFPDDSFGEESRFGIPFTVSVLAVASVMYECSPLSLTPVHLEGHSSV